MKGTYKELSSENVLKVAPEPVSGEPEEGFKLIQELGYCGRDPEVINIDDLSHTSIVNSSHAINADFRAILNFC